MKKYIIIALVLFAIILIPGCYSEVDNTYFRIHIRANSNSETDQNIKYLVKDVVVEYLTPKLKSCTSKNDAISAINTNLHSTKILVDNVLKDNGFNYECNVKINNEFFPTRTYDDLTLDAGYYDALIIELGSGEGNNWWCVMYPNLCFNEIDNVVYKSKIMEIINKIKG